METERIDQAVRDALAEAGARVRRGNEEHRQDAIDLGVGRFAA